MVDGNRLSTSKKKKNMTETHFEVVQQLPAGDLHSSDLFLHQVFWRQQRRDEVHELLLKILINI